MPELGSSHGEFMRFRGFFVSVSMVQIQAAA